jgi:hypothetical protein
MGPAAGKKGLEIKVAITMPSRLRLLTIYCLAIVFGK